MKEEVKHDVGPTSRRKWLSAGLSALAAGLLLKVVGSDEVVVKRAYGADGSALVIGVGNTGSSMTSLSSPVAGGPAAYFVNTGTGDAQAIQGNMTGTTGRAFVGFASATSGNTIALDGVCNSPGGIGLRGANTATTGDAIGVQGSTLSSAGAAFKALGPGGEVMRVRGDGRVGIGTSIPERMVHILGSGPRILIESTDGFAPEVNFALPGDTSGDIWALYKHGVSGDLRFYQNGDRVTLQKDTGNVGIGDAPVAGVKLYVNGDTSAIIAHANSSSPAFEANQDGSGYAGYFTGSVNITSDLNIAGTLTKHAGAFKIDHPLDPANKYLYHSFVESPDMLNVYTGNAVLDANAEAWVELPMWFEALNRDFQYQLTPIGAAMPNLHIAENVGNRFKIGGGKPGMKVSWQVTGIRQDAYANAHRIPVEEEKPDKERGYYLHPELYGQPETKVAPLERVRDRERSNLKT